MFVQLSFSLLQIRQSTTQRVHPASDRCVPCGTAFDTSLHEPALCAKKTAPYVHLYLPCQVGRYVTFFVSQSHLNLKNRPPFLIHSNSKQHPLLCPQSSSLLIALLYFPLLKWYCFLIGLTKTSNGSISLSGNKPNSVQKNMKCLKQVFKCGAICNASKVPKKLL